MDRHLMSRHITRVSTYAQTLKMIGNKTLKYCATPSVPLTRAATPLTCEQCDLVPNARKHHAVHRCNVGSYTDIFILLANRVIQYAAQDE